MMAQHGVKGAVVEVTDSDVQQVIRDIKKFIKRDRVTPAALKNIHADLAQQLTAMMPDIMRHGTAISSNGEFYDRETFDNDLVICAIYDHLANGKQIAITDNIGPRSGDKVH